jgi:hypothetical protein
LPDHDLKRDCIARPIGRARIETSWQNCETYPIPGIARPIGRVPSTLASG